MRKSSASLFIVLAIVAAILIFFFVKFGLSLNTISEVSVEKANLQDAVAALKNEDCVIYWIGDVPAHIESANLNIIKLDSFDLNDTNLPTETRTFNVTISDQEGNVLETSGKREYAENIFIVVNPVSGLSKAQWEIVNKCAVSNGATVYVFGENNVTTYRSLLLMPISENDHYCSMRFSLLLGTAMDIINEEYATDFSSYDKEFSVQLLNIMLSDIVKTDEAVVETTLYPLPETSAPEVSAEPSLTEEISASDTDTYIDEESSVQTVG